MKKQLNYFGLFFVESFLLFTSYSNQPHIAVTGGPKRGSPNEEKEIWWIDGWRNWCQPCSDKERQLKQTVPSLPVICMCAQQWVCVCARVHASRRFGRGGTTICLVRVGCVCMCASGGRQAEINGWLSVGGGLVQVNGPLPPAEKYPCARGLTRMDRVRSTHKALGVQFTCLKMPTLFFPTTRERSRVQYVNHIKKALHLCWLSSSGSRSYLDDHSTLHLATLDLHISCQFVGTFYFCILLENIHICR